MKEISAGGVVYKKVDDQLFFLMIEDRYGKRTLAKGKQEAGETLEETALREVLEETGVRGKIISHLETISYTYVHPVQDATVDKEVHYYLIEALTDDVVAQMEEINAVFWREPLEAWRDQQQRGYDNNECVVRKALEHFGIEV